jgi:5-formyltetrahydrofolate cyclo-ligase
MRAVLRDNRKAIAAEAPDAAERAAALFPPDRFANVRIVSGFRAFADELDPWPLMRRLAEAGARLALPAVVGRGQPLAFRRYAPGDPLAPDAAGIAAPPPDAEVVRPDLVIAPLLAFDRFGGRLGQGGGYYDRTLAALRAQGPVFVLGLAHAGQAVARVPMDAHDQRLDAILTETAYIEAEKDL